MSVKLNIETLAEGLVKRSVFDDSLYNKYGVKRGLRNSDGTGVPAGITRVSNVHGYYIDEYARIPCEGELFYRGISVADIASAADKRDGFAYEEASWLLLFGSLPTADQLEYYMMLTDEYRELPKSFIEDMIMPAPSRNVMNKIARSILALYSYDDDPENAAVENVLRQSLALIARMPLIVSAAYQVKRRSFDNETFFLHSPICGLTMAETILSMLRIDRKYTREEARLLDKCLLLHAEHGGGNNSTFAVRSLTSSGTDTYSAISAGVGALKGHRHGGANVKVMEMLDSIKENVRDYKDDEEISAYLKKILAGNAGDGSGLIYGMGHAVYTLSDPRAKILRAAAEEHCDRFGLRGDFELLSAVERLSPRLLGDKMQEGNAICANVDLYSGIIYRMLKIPPELFTPLFAIARMSGWCAHRLEELITCRRIMRPAYRPLFGKVPYTELENRTEE